MYSEWKRYLNKLNAPTPKSNEGNMPGGEL
jgi:hypothetical protein